MKIMVIGSGGREHAICWRLAQSTKVNEVVCVPGNGGTAQEDKCRNINPADCEYLDDIKGVQIYSQIATFEQVDFVIVGPENPLCDGVADAIWNCGIPVVGPKKDGAQLEASKDFSKKFMHKYGVACADSITVTTAEEAKKYIHEKGAPIVVKADGLAAGKGVVVAATEEQANAAIDDFMSNNKLGDAGQTIVLEEYLQGTEISVLAAVSVTPQTAQANTATIVPFMPSRDHKRLNDGAKGPNTGGMGAICPLEDVDDATMTLFYKNCMQPTLDGMIAEKWDYRGFIFFGVMLTKEGPKLLEYNVRLGDPETQAVLPLMDFDFAELGLAIIDKENNGALKKFAKITDENPAGTLAWKKGFICAPVAVSGGYPASYNKGYEITIDKKIVKECDAKVFIAGAQGSKKLLTSGGRVLACSALGSTFDEAWNNAYKAIKAVQFKDMFYRKDIGLPGAAESGEL
ncbi:MAG: phosphoribosylamine--glycine ligase [Treponema sp. CETP13]|nr:MAG: phosphoribosylamine--glycine ligase [Treponema sp. CETP13]